MFKVFPVSRATLRPFRGQISYPLFADIDDATPFTWNTNDETTLLNTFKQQLETNVFTFIEHNIKCSQLLNNDVFDNTFFVGLSKEEAVNRCNKFVDPEVRKGYEDTFFKDTEVFAEEGDKTSQVYAVVLLSDDHTYQGHIYTWTTGQNCVAFGIRGRPDKAFAKTPTSSIAHTLIGKISELALSQGCTQVVIPNPLPVMKMILTDKFAFAYKRMNVADIGNTFVGYVPDGRLTVGVCVKTVDILSR